MLQHQAAVCLEEQPGSKTILVVENIEGGDTVLLFAVAATNPAA